MNKILLKMIPKSIFAPGSPVSSFDGLSIAQAEELLFRIKREYGNVVIRQVGSFPTGVNTYIETENEI